ncbi:heavy-metal-associated domain-containing protein [Flavobacterium sp. WC2509]|uniref:heavy-metal-associated domain-containing protein n=1 Tax=Flavobacterium sp. WC2509 TaxID=3461406 RepID=UPI004044A065
MNFTKTIAVIVLSGVFFASCKDNKTEVKAETASTEATTPKVKKEIATENLQTASFTIEGMTCAVGCAATIQEELTALDGVQTAKVDFDKKLATVTFDKTIQNPENLTKIVQATGDGKTYKVSNMKS